MEALPQFRLLIFIGILGLFIALEAAFPARKRLMKRWPRWRTNLSLSALGVVVGFLLSPIVAISVAAFAAAQGWGLFNLISFGPPSLEPWIEGLIAIILLDFAIWAQHVAFHHVPWFWRLHSVHHTDRDLDATSGVRFHPVEIGVSLFWKAAVILMLGPLVIAAVIFEIVLNGMSIYTHSNIALPGRLDRAMRSLFVTPTMHRIHHSVIEPETNSNYGFNLSVWDRLFRTYRHDAAQPLTLGLAEHQSETPARLWDSLRLPFRRSAS